MYIHKSRTTNSASLNTKSNHDGCLLRHKNDSDARQHNQQSKRHAKHWNSQVARVSIRVLHIRSTETPRGNRLSHVCQCQRLSVALINALMNEFSIWRPIAAAGLMATFGILTPAGRLLVFWHTYICTYEHEAVYIVCLYSYYGFIKHFVSALLIAALGR